MGVCLAFALGSIFSGRLEAQTYWNSKVVNIPLSGTMTLTGQILVDSEAELTGQGTLALAGNQIDGDPNAPANTLATLFNLNDIVSGSGFIGGESLGDPGLIAVTNDAGTILSTTNQTLIINPDPNRGVTNKSRLEAAHGGYLGLYGAADTSGTGITPIFNNGGLIVAIGSGQSSGPVSAGVSGSSSVVELSDVEVYNGALTASSGGVLLFDTTSVVNNATVTVSGDNSQVDIGFSDDGLTPDVTFNTVSFTAIGGATGQGIWIQGNGGQGPTTFNQVSFLNHVPVNLVGADVLITGTLNNTGTLSFDDPRNMSGNASSIAISGTVILTGSGTISLLDNSEGTPQHQLDGNPGDDPDTDELINVNNTITGTGYIGGTDPGTPGLLELDNEATIQSGSNDTLIINPDADLGVINTGHIQAINGGYLQFVGASNNNNDVTPVYNAGGAIVAAGSGVNSGPVSAGVTGSASIVEFSGVHVYYGTLTATNGGVLIFDTASVVDGASIVLTGDNSQVNVGVTSTTPDLTPDVTFNDDTFTATGGTTGQGIWILGNGGAVPTTFNNVNFLDKITVDLVNAGLLLTGAVNNTGTINFDDPNNQSGVGSDIEVSGVVLLTGSGTVDLFNNSDGAPQHQIDGNPNDDADTDALVNINNTITGTGFLGSTGSGNAGLMMLTNEATILAALDDAIVIDPNPDLGVVNTGLIKAETGGYVGFYGASNNFGGITPIDNTGGTIVADGGGPNDGPYYSGVTTGSSSVVEFNSVDLTGGKLTASNGGVLLFDTESIVNDAAITLTGDNSQVNVGVESAGLTPDVTFNNVTFTGDGSPVGQGIWVNNVGGDSVTGLTNVSFLGGVAVNLLNANVLVTGSLVNTGTLSFDDPSNPSDQSSSILLSGTVTLTGSGTISLFNNTSGIPQHQIDANPADAPGAADLINVNNTITGTGFIGENQFETSSLLMLTNEGTILAGDGDTLEIEPDADLGVVNTGLIKAVSGGYLGLYGDPNSTGGITAINNTGGSIVASGIGDDAGPVHAGVSGSASIVEISTVNLTGGKLTAGAGGVLLFDTGSIVNNAAISLTGDNSQVNIGLDGGGLTPDVTFNNVTFTGDGSPAGQGVWVTGTGGTGPTTFHNVSFLGGVAVNLVGANVMVTGTLTNTGALNFDDPASPSGKSSTISVSGLVVLNGGGTVNLLNNGGTPGHVIDGNYNAAKVSQNELINQNDTIIGSGYIGGTPSGWDAFTSATQFVNDGTVIAGTSNDITMVSGPTYQGAIPSPVQNNGYLQVDAGGLMSVAGNFAQSGSGTLFVELGGLTSTSTNDLGSPATYSHLDVSGTATLNGTFELSLTNGFSPQLGNVFQVLNDSYTSGQFSGYLGLLLSSSLVLEPSYNSAGLTLTVSTETPGTSAPLQPVTSGSIAIASGSTYAGIIATSTVAGGNGTVLTVLGGTATSSTTVTVSFQTAGAFAASKGGFLVSDIANFHGTGTNTFVLQISYNPAALSAGENVNSLYLAWLDPGGAWENAVLGNTGNSIPNEIFGAYNPATDFVLGDYGIDSIDDRVWAVLDHNSEFAVSNGLVAVPEPSTWGLLALAAMPLGAGSCMRRRSRR